MKTPSPAPPTQSAHERTREREPAREPPRGAQTLYQADMSDPRARAALPRENARGRAARRVEETSDVTRFRGVLTATLVGAGTAAAAALLFPPPGGHGSGGPLSRPHVQAGLSCASCHTSAQEDGKGASARSASRAGDNGRAGSTTKGAVPGATARAPIEEAADGYDVASAAQACPSCHGTHGSTRAGHQRLLAGGAMTCATCHRVHRGDQGVVLRPEGRPIRFAPGAEAEVAVETAFKPTRAATVALVTAGACAGCHDLAAPRDPVARCLAEDLRPLGSAQPVACFDEHQLTLPEAEPERARQARLGSGVCRAQHTEDRALAWGAAREIARAVPEVPGVVGAVPAQSLAWAGAGLAAAALSLAGTRGARWVRARRRKKQAPPPETLVRPATRVRLPQIDTTTCLGCYACVDACPYDVLAIERYVAVVARPEACCGLTLCEQRCPNGSLKITDGELLGDRPRLDDDLQSVDVPGLYLAGDITGLPLIKNAIFQGARAVERVAAGLGGEGKRRGLGRGRGGAGGSGSAGGGGAAHEDEVLDLVIVGAGPAGISAALRARELGLGFEVIEQGSVAASIRSFPRGKLVFDQPLELPLTGKLWLKESTKEELLAQWMRVVRAERLPILEQTRMVAVRRGDAGEGFVVVTAPSGEGKGEPGPRQERRARRVLLALGQRGSPRRLPVGVPAEVEDRVYYHLADARSLEGERVLVVGLGDVAMEAAIALARQPGTEVTLAARADGFRRGRPRNIEEVRRLAGVSRLSLEMETQVAALAQGERGAVRVTLASPRGRRELTVDVVLVLIGSIPPWEALRAAGVQVSSAEKGELPATARVQEPVLPSGVA